MRFMLTTISATFQTGNNASAMLIFAYKRNTVVSVSDFILAVKVFL